MNDVYLLRYGLRQTISCHDGCNCYAHMRYVKSFVINIQKQCNMSKISLNFKKFTNFANFMCANNSIIFRIKNAKF